MKKRLLAPLLLLLLASFPAQSQPSLSIQLLDRQNLQISWPSTATGLALEQTPALTSAATWQAIQATPVLQNGRLAATLPLSAAAQFFRLRQGTSLTSITAISPVDGETGVAVTRETIVHFSGALAANAVIKTNNFYAVATGRGILSRVELSSDRTKATLFYLEPLPGSARVNVFFDAEGLTDSLGRPLDPAGTGTPNGLKVFSFETLSLTPLTGTAVIGRVFASELMPGSDTGTNAVNRPLEGVTITVDGREQDLRTKTDALGNFTLAPVPPGRFFVKIDGRTAKGSVYPNGTYYPYVGKAWEAVAGKTNNLAGGTGEIFLPLIAPGTLQPVSMTQDTPISFPSSVIAANPALAGVTITVPANSLFSDDGTRGGKVGIAPVPPDRLPGPLPPGLEAPIVITVQTDGPLNFDKPAPICFPNLPDPVLKTPLPAGSKQALVSFNHKKGIWEAVGSMTVSADGKFICSDPGAGILQPGWHVPGPVPDGPPPCNELCCDGGGGGGPPGGFGPLPADSGSLTVGKMKKPPAQCTSKPCKDKYKECIQRCDYEHFTCTNGIRIVLLQCIKKAKGSSLCDRPVADRPPGCETMLRECNEIWRTQDRLCDDAQADCYDDCFEACKKGTPSSIAKASPNAEPVINQIATRLSEFSMLMEPYRLPDSQIPPDVITRIFQVFDEIDAVAGGDAIQFLRQNVLLVEEEVQKGEDEFGENPGNAPLYPVLYAAEIVRPDGNLTVRGETGPFGQYTLFIPRDGQLLYVSFYDPHTKQFGTALPRLRPGARHRMPRFTLRPVDDTFPDNDHDGLPDAVEFVYGTDETNPDSDGDGVPDGAEVDAGTNPLDGLPVCTGVVGTAKTLGNIVDVWAGNDLVVTAEWSLGISVFNTYQGMNPVLIAHVPTPDNAQRVAVSGNHVAVAAGEAGLLIIDLSTPAEARIVNQVRFGNVTMVVATGGIAYVGQSVGTLKAVELTSGRVLSQTTPPGPLRDLALAGDHLYARTDDQLVVLSLADGGLAVTGSVSGPERVNARLFVGGGTAWSVDRGGYDTFDVSDPARPRFLATASASFSGWLQIVPNGSGLGLAVVGGGLSLYDLSDTLRKNDIFVTQFVTPGRVSAAAIFNGLAYAGGEGLQVVNYMAYDAKGVPPKMTIDTSAAGGMAETGRQFRVTANAVDDVQVRNVEFYIDGQRTFSDGNFPFEYRFDPPALTAAKTDFKLRARAIDTGGNSTWSEELTIKLGPDVTPPRIVTTAPLGGAKVVTSVSAQFNEPMNPATLNAGSFRLIAAGSDGLFDTADDLPVGGGAVNYQAESMSVSLDFSAPLPDGLYRAVVTTAAKDASGNGLASDYTWQFRVANAVFWSSNTDGFWEDGSNWSTGAVPGPTDDIFIESIPGDVTIFHGRGTRVIKRLVVGELVIMTGATWQISETMELRQSLTLNGSTLQGGTIKQSRDGKLFFAPNMLNTLEGVSVEGDLDLTRNVARALIRNGLMLRGNVLLDNSSIITFAGDQTFNSGSIIFLGNSAALEIAPSTTLTLGPKMVVRGKGGFIGGGAFGTRKLINQGLIAADVAGGTLTIGPAFENVGTLECKGGGSLTLGGGDWRNAGQINASGGGTLTFSNPSTWSNTGTIKANDVTVKLGGTFALGDIGTFNRVGGTLNLTGLLDLKGGTLILDTATGPWRLDGGTLKGGTVKQSGEGKLLFARNGENKLDDVHIEGDLELTSDAGRTQIRNGLTLTGSVLLDNAGGIIFSGDQTFNSGSIVFLGNSAAVEIAPNTTLTLGPAMVVRGKTGFIGGGAFGTRKLINQGLISADVAGGTLTIGPAFENVGMFECKGGGSLTLSGGDWRNAGQINASGGGTLTFSNPSTWSNSGTITADEVTVNLGGTFTLADIGTFRRTGGTVNLTGTLDLRGATLTLDATTGPWRMNAGTLKGGTVKQSGAKLLFAGNAANTLDGITVEGDLELTSTSARAVIRNGLTLTGAVILDNAGGITFAGDQPFNTGSIVFAGNSGVLAMQPGTTLTLGPAMVVHGKSGIISASAFGTGTVKLINQGVIAVDVAGGTLTISPTQFENPGTLRVDGAGASVVVRVTGFTNAGKIEELNGGKVLINP